jgi:septal ring factor EnvC (AmiA/AmiB activator)
MFGISSKALTMVKEELGSAQRMVEKANKQLKESQIELDKLMAENAKLKAGLANAENQADASDVQDLKERLQGE